MFVWDVWWLFSLVVDHVLSVFLFSQSDVFRLINTIIDSSLVVHGVRCVCVVCVAS